VKPGDLRNLVTVTRRYPPSVVQRNLAAVNKAVAENPDSKESVSESCFTGHLHRDGAGELIPHDANPGGKDRSRLMEAMIASHDDTSAT
jgi:hypothetical protein